MVFFWKQPGKRACDTVDDAVWYWFTLPLFAGLHWALLTLVFTDDAVALVCLAFFANPWLS
ncbi:hypothetical protein T09_13809 [Trichinella sp. T9]|nr:hypothetical protein T09_13809 [Trichinella sp. T9]